MRRGDKVVIGIIILLSFSLFFISKSFFKEGMGKYISIQVSRKEIKKIPLNSVKGKEKIVINGKNGTNTLEIDKEGGQLLKSDCPDQICVHMGKIKEVGEMIVCLPHEVLIEIKSDEAKEDDLDILLR